ncbi:MAG: hypothetical protein ACYCPM_01970, partial [Acidobacteriaceae bacterium]
MVSSAANRARSSASLPPRPAAIGFKIPRLRFEVRLAGLLVLLTLPTLTLGCVALYMWHASI